MCQRKIRALDKQRLHWIYIRGRMQVVWGISLGLRAGQPVSSQCTVHTNRNHTKPEMRAIGKALFVIRARANQYNAIQYGSTQLDIIRHSTSQYDTVRHNMKQSAQVGLNCSARHCKAERTMVSSCACVLSSLIRICCTQNALL